MSSINAPNFSSHIYLLREQEKNIIFDIIENEETKKIKILRWGEILEKRIEAGDLEITENYIVSYMRKELRARGWTEYQIDYIGDFTPQKWKNENLNRQIGRVNPADSFTSNNIFFQYAQLSEKLHNKGYLVNLSPAEKLELYDKHSELRKEINNRTSGDVKMIETQCLVEGIRIPQLEKESADKCPERFSGQSNLYESVKLLKQTFERIAKRFDRIQDMVKEFKPSEEIAEKASTHLHEYMQKIGDPFEKMIALYCKGLEDILIPLDDSKFGACAGDWLKISFDKYDSCGSHGSGKTNAVPTGIFAMKMSKDNQGVVITPVKREFTREIVGDRSAKDMLLKAHNYLQLQNIEQFIQTWSKNTTFEEIIKEPEEFFKEERKRVQQEIILKGGGANK